MKFIFKNHTYVIRNDVVKGVSYGEDEVAILIGANQEESLTFLASNDEDLKNIMEAITKWSRDWYKA